MKRRVEFLCYKRYTKELPQDVAREIRLRPLYGKTHWEFVGPGFRALWTRKGPGRGAFEFSEFVEEKVKEFLDSIDCREQARREAERAEWERWDAERRQRIAVEQAAKQVEEADEARKMLEEFFQRRYGISVDEVSDRARRLALLKAPTSSLDETVGRSPIDDSVLP